MQEICAFSFHTPVFPALCSTDNVREPRRHISRVSGVRVEPARQAYQRVNKAAIKCVCGVLWEGDLKKTHTHNEDRRKGGGRKDKGEKGRAARETKALSVTLGTLP